MQLFVIVKVTAGVRQKSIVVTIYRDYQMPFFLIAIGFVYTKTVYTLTQVSVFTATLQWIFHNELFSRTLNFNLPQREAINIYDAHFD